MFFFYFYFTLGYLWYNRSLISKNKNKDQKKKKENQSKYNTPNEHSTYIVLKNYSKFWQKTPVQDSLS